METTLADPQTGRRGRPTPPGVREIFTTGRAFYLDIAEWALEDPSWVPWAAPIPIRKSDTAGQSKHKRKVTAQMHQRVRERLPHLPTLVACAERHRNEQAAFLAATRAVPNGGEFDHAGRRYRRIAQKNTAPDAARYSAVVDQITVRVQLESSACLDRRGLVGVTGFPGVRGRAAASVV